MTLCVGWIRQVKDSQELIFATDSCLSAGERWDSGVKLFELPRRDSLICFSGYTVRTYPMILSLINALKYDKHASNPNYDVTLLVDYITSLFTDVVRQIYVERSKPTTYEDVLKEDPEFDFMFGGWSWKENQFKLWRIAYSSDAGGFIPTSNYDRLVFEFIGDHVETAKRKLEEEITAGGKILAGKFDMEPLKVLLQMIRETEFDSISGPIQLAKIYPPGIVELFGVYYPSIVQGKKTFLGRDVSQTNNPGVRFVDPDTGSVVDTEIPEVFDVENLEEFGADVSFIQACYPDGRAKGDLTDRDREMLRTIFKENAYSKYLKSLEKQIETAKPIDETAINE